MPYYRRRKTYRRRRSRQPWYRKKYNAAQLAYKAYKGVRYIKGLVNSEMFHDGVNNSAAYSWSGALQHITAISQDDTVSGRTGNSVLLRQMWIKWTASINSSATNTLVRVMIICDKQQVGDTSPSASTVLDQTGTIQAPFGNLAVASVGRFKVLYSKVVNLNQDRPTTMQSHYFNMRTHVRYNGTADTDIQKNGHYVLIISNEETNTPTIQHNIRIGYHDN